MNSTYEDTLFDFDLNLLNQTANVATIQEKFDRIKQKKSVALVKKKIIATDSLIAKYYGKRVSSEETDKALVAYKEECKQSLIKYRDVLESYNQLQNDYQKIQIEHAKCPESLIAAKNQTEASMSHAHQLQVLLKEKETEITRGEKKSKKASDKNYDKKVEQTIETLRKDLFLFINLVKKQAEYTKRPLKPKYKSLIKTYETSREGKNHDWGAYSDAEDNIFEDAVLSPPPNIVNMVKKCSASTKDMVPIESDNDYSNEVVSIDTGRGSSLAFSDTEKCINSPDYFINDSPLNGENIVIKARPQVVSIATSPIMFEVSESLSSSSTSDLPSISESPNSLSTVDISLTPIIVKKTVYTSPLKKITKEIATCTDKINNTVSTSPIKKITREIATCTDKINNTVSTSPIKKITREIATSTDEINNTVSTSSLKKVREIATNTDEINDTVSNSQIKKITREIATSTDYINNMVSTSLIKKVREIATNTDEIIDTVSSSLIKKITKEIATNTDEINNTVSTSPIKKLTREIATCTDKINNTVSTSPLQKVTREICTSTYDNLDEVTTGNKVHTHIAQAKECLELNNSNNLSHDNNMDYEIESILNTMKLDYKTVSPIPRTPSTLRGEATHVVSMLSDHNEHLRICKHCKSAQKIREKKFNELKAMICSMEPFILNNNINSNDTTEIVYSENNVRGLQNVIPEESTEEIYENSNWIQIDLTQSNPPLLPDENDIPVIDTNTENLNNRRDENSLPEISLSRLQDQNPKQIVTVEQTRDSEIHTDKDKEESPNNSVVNKQPPTKNSNIKKGRSKKTKLEKLRKSLKPKYKIRSETPPISKSRIKQTQRTVPENKVTESINTSTSLNDKNAYARAVKVMAEINSQKLSQGLSQKPDQSVKNSSPKRNVHIDDHIDSGDNNTNVTSPKSLITTRSKRKYVELDCSVMLEKNPLVTAALETKNSETIKVQNTKMSTENTPRKRRQRSFDSEIQPKRVLRSATISQRRSTENKQEVGNAVGGQHRKSIEATNANGNEISDTPLHVVPDIPNKDQAPQCQQVDRPNSNVISSYDGLDIFSVDTQPEKETCPVKQSNTYFLSGHPRESILCTMLLRYGSESGRKYVKTVPEATLRVVCEKFEQEIPKIITLPNDERKNAMIRFAADLQKLNCKHLVTGLIMYLSKPDRKMELFGKIKSSYCPAMTEYEQILLFLIRHLKTHWTSVDLVDAVLSSIEYSIFKLNRTPDFNVIESISHFYALLCRYHGAMSRLRIFMLDALYCIQFKAIPLIKQCLDVWMQIIPLAHMRNAKTPLVMCLVYLLHFYKCVDKYNRVQEMRNILSRKYFYQITDWNERQILEVFKQAIMDVNDNPIERKMLRMALIILAKRQGPQWCQNQIIKNLLLPLIEKKNVSNTVKEFCVCMIGPLMKPYPADMKVYCEIAFNQLTNILGNEPSRSMEEAAIRSMMLINRHNQYSINKMLLKRRMINPMSLDLEETLRDYVKTKPLKIWLKMLPKISLN